MKELLRYKSTSTLRKKNQQSMPENLNKFANNELKIDPNNQKGELIFSPENMFYPVLGIKKTTNLYQKKLIKKKQTFLNLNYKNEMYKSQHFNHSDDETFQQPNKNVVNKGQVKIFYKEIFRKQKYF